MASTTVLDIITRALRIIGIKERDESASGEEADDALKVLNMIIGQWNSERLMVNGWISTLTALTIGKADYTIGAAGADITMARPFKIERAFCRYNSSSPTLSYDYQLEIVPVGKYQEVFLKGLTTTYPVYLWYNPTYPLGAITLYPVPGQACSLGITSYGQITEFSAYTTLINLAPGYDIALAYALAVDMLAEYGKTLDPLIQKRADETKAAVMRANTEMSYLKSDNALLQRKVFNITTGSYQ